MATFEGYERRIAKINAVLDEYGIQGSWKKCKSSRPRQGRRRATRSCEGIQPIAFENAVVGLHAGRGHRHQEGRKDRRRRRRVHRRGPAGLLHPRLRRRPAQGRPRPRQPGRDAAARGDRVLLPSWPAMSPSPPPKAPSASPATANKVRKKPLRVILNGLGKDAAYDHQPHQRLHLCADRVRLRTPSEADRRQRDRLFQRRRAQRSRCYGADDVREGVAIMRHENVDVSITGNSTNPTRFQHPGGRHL